MKRFLFHSRMSNYFSKLLKHVKKLNSFFHTDQSKVNQKKVRQSQFWSPYCQEVKSFS